jgi:tetratricopeptide (TPR) repeat protein
MNSSPSSVPNFFFTLSLATALAVLAGCNPKDGVREFADGMTAYEARSLEKAEKLFAKSLVYAPENVDALVMLARVKCDLGEMSDAGDTIAKAAALAPDAPDVALLDAEIALYAGDYARATSRFSGVANDEKLEAPARALGWTGLGIVEMTRDNRDLARIAFLTAIRLDRRNAPARYHLGLLYRGDKYSYLDAALEQFEIFVRLGETADPRAVHAQRTIIPGIKTDIARRAAERPGAQRRDANASAAALSRADAAWKKKNYKVAKSEYEAACKADVLSFPAALGLAKVCAATAATPADRQRALDCYKTACSLRPGSVSTFLAAGELATAVKQYATAVELYSRAVAADPSNISAIDGLIRSLRKTGDGKTADAYQRYRDTISAKKAK